MSEENTDQRREEEPPLPFTPEQLQWIDRMIANRVQPSGEQSSSGDLAASASGSTNPTGTSAVGTLATAASQPGLPTALPSMASVAFVPLMSTGTMNSLATAAKTAGGGLASSSSVLPRMSVSPTAPVVPEASIPGWSAVPPRILKKIWNLEYVDMGELLPESWRLEPTGEGCCRSQRPRRGPITDFSLWTECFATLVAVLAVRYPEKTPHFMAYLRTITRAARNFDGSAWATYDMAYRRQAANQRSLDWGVVDSALYSEAFTGRARSIPRCQYCCLDTHKSQDCAFAPAPDDRKGKPQPTAPPQDRGQGAAGAVDICRLFNKAAGNQCRYRYCRYAHICSKCRRGAHPAAECTNRYSLDRRSRSPSPKGKGKM